MPTSDAERPPVTAPRSAGRRTVEKASQASPAGQPDTAAIAASQNGQRARIDAQKRSASSIVSAVIDGLSEREFQTWLRAALRDRGWVVYVVPDMRKTLAGLPDLIAIHLGKPGRLLAWELKSTKGRIRPEQRVVIDHLRTVPGVDARIVRPSDWDELIAEADR